MQVKKRNMPKLTNTNILKKNIIDALTKSLGVITPACKKLGIARVTFYEWYNNDPEFKKQVDELNDIALDFAETKLYQQIDNNDTTATIFYLKTKGKKRGYQEKIEMETNITGLREIVIEPVKPKE